MGGHKALRAGGGGAAELSEASLPVPVGILRCLSS
jgi:hypothetical protein